MTVHGDVATQLARGRMVSAAAVAAVLLQLPLLLGASPSAAAGLVVVSVALLGVLATLGASSSQLFVAPAYGAASSSDADEPVVRGPATDPVHHPLAPRAPGPA